MSIVILGRSHCKICGRIIEEGDDVTGFPAFTSNELDPLVFFNDAAFHTRCFDSHHSSDNVRNRMAERESKVGPQNRKCDICQKPISSYKENFELPYLIDESGHPSYALNYFQAHRGCMTQWSNLRKIHGTLKALRMSDKWKGDGLDSAILEIEMMMSKQGC